MQFSPTSEHILLAYGRRHGSLLKSIVVDGETALPIYTILEVKVHFFLVGLSLFKPYCYLIVELLPHSPSLV